MTVSTIPKKLVLQAIQTLREINKKLDDSRKKKPLLEEDGKSLLFLQITLKKIPKTKLIKMIKVNLPHSLVRESEEVCLITGDLDKNNRKSEIGPDVLHYKTLLQEYGITQISQVITLRQLRTEYKPYEAKQKLLAAYDLFLADSKIVECLPRVLGRHFFEKRKLPIQINMKTGGNLKQEVQKALSVKKIYISGRGNSSCSEVAYLDMADTEILENILAMAEALSKNAPGSWDNIMGIYLKTAKSQAVPIYMSYESPNDIQLKEEKDEDDILMDELSTIPDIRVKVHMDGKVETVYVKDEPETSLTDGSDTEKCNLDLELPNLTNGSDVEECETESTKQIKTKKDKTAVNRKRKSIKQELVSFNPSHETTSNKKVKLEEETTSAKPKKKKTEKKHLSLDQSVQQAIKKVKLGKETKPVKPKKENSVKKPLFLDQSVQQVANKKVELEEEPKPVKPKRKCTLKKPVSLNQSVQQGKRSTRIKKMKNKEYS